MSLKGLTIAIAAGLLLYHPSLRAQEDCRSLLGRRVATSTENFQAYAEELLRENIIGDEELMEFFKNLKAGKIVNPISEELAVTDLSLQIHRDGFQNLIRRGDLETGELEAWVEERLVERNIIRQKREVVREATEELPRNEKIEFWRRGWWEEATKADLRIIDTNAKYGGRYVIDYAAVLAPEKTLRMFLKLRGPDIDINVVDYMGNPVVTNVIAHGLGKNLQALVDAGVDLEAEDEWGNTALRSAVEHGQRESVQILVDAGPDLEAIETALDAALGMAKGYRDRGIIEILRKAREARNLAAKNSRPAQSKQ